MILTTDILNFDSLIEQHSFLNYERSMTSECKDTGIKKSEFLC